MKCNYRVQVCFLLLTIITLSSCAPSKQLASTGTPIPSKTSTPTLTSTSTPVPTRTPRVNQTTSGNIKKDEIWRGEILVTGDIEIAQGVTLLIEPGTIVKFTGQSDDSPVEDSFQLKDTAEYNFFPNDPPRIAANMINILILGTMIANGTLENPIVFTSNKTSPALNDWQSLSVESNGKLDMSFAVIEYNYHGVDIHNVYNPNVLIRNTVFRHIAGCCICTGGGSPIPKGVIIQENKFSDCNHEGIDTYKDQNLVIRNNLFEDNFVGIVANNGSTVTIENNIFQKNRRCAIGIWNSSSPVIHYNNFFDNSANICINNSTLRVDAKDNYWGSENPRPGGQGYVEFKPFSSTPFDIEMPTIPMN